MDWIKFGGDKLEPVKLKEFEEAVRAREHEVCMELVAHIPPISPYHKIMIACIGTPKAIFDRVGPLVGSILSDSDMGVTAELGDYPKVDILGTCYEPLTAVTVEESVFKYAATHYNENVFTIALDSSMCYDEEDLYKISVKNRGVRPGGALSDKLPRVGDIGILCATIKKPDYFHDVGDLFYNDWDPQFKQMTMILAKSMARIIIKALLIKKEMEKGEKYDSERIRDYEKRSGSPNSLQGGNRS